VGQRSTFKTFFLNTFAVAGAHGSVTFANQDISRPGLVVQMEFEGSQSDIRVVGVRQALGIAYPLPILFGTNLPPTVIRNKRPNPDWKGFADELVQMAQAEAKALGLPIFAITLDPSNKFAGFTSEDDSAEVNVFGRAMDELARAAKCLWSWATTWARTRPGGRGGRQPRNRTPISYGT
jgi:hypothetical protein